MSNLAQAVCLFKHSLNSDKAPGDVTFFLSKMDIDEEIDIKIIVYEYKN
jgi:hypothetical protein